MRDRIAVAGGFAVIILICAAAEWVKHVHRQTDLYQTQLGNPIRSQLGFDVSSPYVRMGSNEREQFVLHPERGKAFEGFGFQDGDIVLSHSITGFFKALVENQGNSIIVVVIEGGDGPPIDERTSRGITFLVPELNLD